jgi:dipeptidyl aminopeptidase/acylaminoacyl peptidase
LKASKNSKEVIHTRKDGVALLRTLYLLVGYDKAKERKLPLLIWAYPAEYVKRPAGQNNQNQMNLPFLIMVLCVLGN